MAQWYSFNGRNIPYDDFYEPFKPSLERLVRRDSHIVLARSCANEAGFELDDLITSEDVELFYYIRQKGEYGCCLTKGWDDPGFVVNKALTIMNHHANYDYKKVLGQIADTCSQHMLVQTSPDGPNNPDDDTYRTIVFQIPIYIEGFNGKVLKEAVRNLEEADKKIQELIGAE